MKKKKNQNQNQNDCRSVGLEIYSFNQFRHVGRVCMLGVQGGGERVRPKAFIQKKSYLSSPN